MNYRHVLGLADQVRMCKPFNDTKGVLAFTQYWLQRAPIFDISNVVDSWPDHEVKRLAEMDGVRPPYESCWFEFSADTGRKGILCVFDKEQKSVDFVFSCVRVRGQEPVILLGGLAYKMTEEGGFQSGPAFPDFQLSRVFEEAKRTNQSVMMQRELAFMSYAALYAMKLLMCKNVEAVEKEPPTTINERHSRQHPPLVKYKVLRVNVNAIPGRSASPSPSNQDSDVAVPHHFCRGHFKNYEGSGLFGKYKGLYWWDSHERGDRKNGEVIKDYEVVTCP